MTESFNCQWFPKQEKDHFQKFHIREFGASAWHPSDHSDYQTTWQWEAMPWHTRTSTDCNAGIGAHGRNSSRGSPKAAAYVLQDAERVCQSPLRPEKHKLHLVLIPFSVQYDVWDSARTSLSWQCSCRIVIGLEPQAILLVLQHFPLLIRDHTYIGVNKQQAGRVQSPVLSLSSMFPVWRIGV